MIDLPKVMGIINITPDSFYAGSRFGNQTALLKQFEKMLVDGADIIDIGGQSTRPGSIKISEEEELGRVMPALELLGATFPDAFISIDTFYSKIASEAVERGACIVNDISCGSIDTNMLAIVGKLNVPYVCMHRNDKLEIKEEQSRFDTVIKEVLDFFIQKTEACRLAGITDVIIDPGFGFGKTIHQNFELLKNLSVFEILDKPILLGVSRKSTIYKTLKTTADFALNGTSVLNTIGLMNGANILRVHDVKEAKEAVLLYQEYNA